MHIELSKRAGHLALLAALCASGAASADLPRSAESYTEEEIYTERHNAASAAVATTNFVVGRLALECHEVLGKPETWVKEFALTWQGKNSMYLRAATLYAANVMSYLERTKGSAAKDIAMQKWRTSVQGQGRATVADLLSARDKREACVSLIGEIEAGNFDIAPAHPLYKEISEIVMVLDAFDSPK
jgi:hypothetical protein